MELIKIIVFIITAAAVLLLVVYYSANIIKERIYAARNKRRLQLIASQGEDMETVSVNVQIDSGNSILAYASQIIGTRNEQQDSFFVSDCGEFDLLKKSYVVAAVCDGMGGLSSGADASRLAIECIKRETNTYFASDEPKNIPEFLKNIAIKANELVYSYGVENGGGQCGTTMVLTIFENNRLYWLSVGDSRIYVIRNGKIIQITNDHNYAYLLEQRVKEGLITREEAMAERNREALISFIGISELDIIDLCNAPIELEKGDIVLLCSDGLYKVMTDEEICEYVNENKNDPEALARNLPSESFDRNNGSQDNTTVAVVCYK